MSTDHCGHIDMPCGCDNAPTPEQAYRAIRQERDEARAALAERDAAIARARELHYAIRSLTGGQEICQEDGDDWPCATVRALGGPP